MTRHDLYNDTHGAPMLRSRLAALTAGIFLLFAGLAAFVPSATASHEGEDGPTIEEVSPEAAPAQTYVYINGSGFSADDRVTFGGYVMDHDHLDDESLGFYAPDYPLGEYEIEVGSGSTTDSFCCFELTDEEVRSGSSDEDETDDENETRDGDDPEDRDSSIDRELDEDEACAEPRKNVQCNEFGAISMQTQHEIEGDPITVDTTIVLSEDYQDQGARSVLFSVRNITEDSPISIELDSISTPDGELMVSRMDQSDPNELNIWVNILDLPLDTPINLTVQVASSERGAYVLETLVMPFDRGYEPVKDASGDDVSLYSYTFLSISDASGSLGSEGGLSFKVPAPSAALVVLALTITLALVGRRRTA